MKHLIDILQLSTQEIDELVAKANDIIAHPDAYAHKCDGKILSTLWLRQDDGTPLRGEISVDGEIILTAEFTSFDFYDTIKDPET